MSAENVGKYGKAASDDAANPPDMEGTVSNVEGSSAETGQLKREFKERHVSMIAVAGAIGTGLI
ncbi:dicarboxylic amino acid permease, partial [Colletotrichum sojae]